MSEPASHRPAAVPAGEKPTASIFDAPTSDGGCQNGGNCSISLNRRRFGGFLVAALAPNGLAQDAKPKPAEPASAGRKLDFRVGDGFGDAGRADITAVLKSAADAIWQHCPNTRWQVPGFFIFHSTDAPITVFDHHADGRIAIGLTTQGTYWAQFAYQFAHEFCHALAGHSNDWKARQEWIRQRKANHWLEESLCETASLFSLRAMGESWKTKPPYPNWKEYARALSSYAADRLEATGKAFPAGVSFADWFRDNEASMRQNATLREKNNVVARELLPLFERTPAAWETVAFLQEGKREPDSSLKDKLHDWCLCVPTAHRAFIRRIGSVFGLTLPEN